MGSARRAWTSGKFERGSTPHKPNLTLRSTPAAVDRIERQQLHPESEARLRSSARLTRASMPNISVTIGVTGCTISANLVVGLAGGGTLAMAGPGTR